MAEPEDLALELMRLPSPSGSEAAVTNYLHRYLEQQGWQTSQHEVLPGRSNLYAHRGEPVVVFSTHLDTVPPDLPISLSDGVLRGRGACDAKGLAAAMIAAASRLVAEGEHRVGLLFLVGEEDGSPGAVAAASIHPKGRYLINGEPTENRLVTAQKGALRAKLRARGRSAHSGYPSLGESAIEHLLDSLQAIRALPLPHDPVLGETTLNIGQIRGGEACNVIPSWAEAELMWRVVAETSPLRQAVTAALTSNCEIEFTLEIPPIEAPGLPGWESSVVSYASDLPLLGAWGVGYQFGPGTIHLAHTDHEHIGLQELHDGVAGYYRLARTLLAREDG